MNELSITTIRDVIDSAFGDEDNNSVDFRSLQAILFILARQLRILQRHVSVAQTNRYNAMNSLSVTEIKIHAKKKRKGSKDSSLSSKDESQKDGKGASQKTKKGAKGGEDQATKGDKDKDSVPSAKKSGKDDEQQAQKSGKSGEQQKGAKESEQQKGTKGGEQQKGTKGGEQQKGTKGGEQQAQKAGKTGRDQSQQVGKSQISKSAEKSSNDKTGKSADTDQYSTGVPGAGKKSVAKGKGREGDGMETIHEKLLIVSRTQSEAEMGSTSSVVTLAQFQDLFLKIRELQTRFGITDLLELPDKAFKGNLHKQFSLTDPMAAVQLSARLVEAEKQLANMMPIAMEHASAIPGIDIDAILGNVDSEGPAGAQNRKSPASKQPSLKKSSHRSAKIDSDEDSSDAEPNFETISTTTNTDMGTGLNKKVTYDELYERLDDVSNDVLNSFGESTVQSTQVANNAFKQMTLYDTKLTVATNVGDKFAKMDLAAEMYSDEVNYLDAKLGSQMTEYQDTLTQMQYDLEAAMDTMAEVLAAPSEDAAAIAELNQHFTSFQYDIDNTADRQRALKREEQNYSIDLSDLKRQINALEKAKSTRDEVTEALSDKAGISALNGMVSMNQFDAVRGDFEKRIASSYDKFNGKEVIWQKLIDDLIRELNEKADHRQMIGLEQEIQKHLDSIKGTLQEMLNVVGEIDETSTNKKIHRTEDCLCCGTPANMKAEKDEFGEVLLRPPVEGAESGDEQELDMADRVCLPGLLVEHKLDPRSEICRRFCGSTVKSRLKRESDFKVLIGDLNLPGPDSKPNQGEHYKKFCKACSVQKLSCPFKHSRNSGVHAADLVSEPPDAISEA